MGRRWTASRVLGACVVMACVVGVAGPASGDRGELLKDRWDDTFVVPDFCGAISVTFHDVGHGITHVRLNAAGFPLFSGTGAGTTTLTDGDGETITIRHAGHFRDLSVTDNGDGTVTVITENTGVPEKLVGDDGSMLLKDVGRIVFFSVINYNGTPSNTDDDVFVSGGIVDVSGPHPDAESDFARFCEVTLGYFAS